MRRFQWIGAGLGIAILIVFLLLPPLAPLTSLGMRTVGVFLCTICFWVAVDTAFSSLLCIALLAVAGVLTPNEAFSASLGSWLPVFLIACFGLSEALSLTGFSRRFAFWFLTRPFAKGHPWILLSLLFLAVTYLGRDNVLRGNYNYLRDYSGCFSRRNGLQAGRQFCRHDGNGNRLGGHLFFCHDAGRSW